MGSLQWYQSFDPPNLWKDRRMQRYIGISMGQRKKPSSETEAEMEGSGDDHEAVDLTLNPSTARKAHWSDIWTNTMKPTGRDRLIYLKH